MTELENTKRLVAEDLLRIGAVFLRPSKPFTWASGIKSPIYCDNRLTLSNVEVRTDIEKAIAMCIDRYFPDREILMGTATAGIAHAAITAQLMELPMGYVRSSAKDHGRGNQIEGKLNKGEKVVVVEDLISTGMSSLEVVQVLKDAGAEVLGVISIFTYGMKKAIEAFNRAGVKQYSLTNLDTLIEVAIENAYISKEEAIKIRKFRAKPDDESWINA